MKRGFNREADTICLFLSKDIAALQQLVEWTLRRKRRAPAPCLVEVHTVELLQLLQRESASLLKLLTNYLNASANTHQTAELSPPENVITPSWHRVQESTLRHFHIEFRLGINMDIVLAGLKPARSHRDTRGKRKEILRLDVFDFPSLPSNPSEICLMRAVKVSRAQQDSHHEIQS